MKKGFTLIEIMVALSIFIIIVTVSMGSILGIFGANRKSDAQSTVMNSLNFAMETLSRELRYGWNYHCDSIGILTDPRSCPLSGGNEITFSTNLSGTTELVRYIVSNGVLQKSVNGGSFIPVTPPTSTLTVDSFIVFVDGAVVPPATTQPRVLIYLRGRSGVGTRTVSQFALETVVSQRKLNN